MLLKQHFLESNSSPHSPPESLCHLPLVSCAVSLPLSDVPPSLLPRSSAVLIAELMSCLASSAACACPWPCSHCCLCFVWSPGCCSAAGDSASHLYLYHWIVLSLSFCVSCCPSGSFQAPMQVQVLLGACVSALIL